jgi:signal transduction histidine kinase
MKVEIKRSLTLSDAEKTEVLMHSLRNVLNVIYTELQFLQKIFKAKNCLARSLSLSLEILASFSDQEKALASAGEMENYRKIILDEIDKALAEHLVEPRHQKFLDEALSNLKSVFAVVEVRIREILARSKAPGMWASFGANEIEKDIKQVLSAIAKNSHGRYNIVHCQENQGPEDYLVELKISGEKEGILFMPTIFQDCFRDLIANARKYTAPGGRIRACLEDDGAQLKLEISDTGRGIPEDEIEEVVEFGARGSNTLPNETKGGGFGLTKAYYVCRQFDGRMWIESELNKGTTVTIHLPRPCS